MTRRSKKKRRGWTEKEDQVLVKRFADTHTAVLARELKRSYGAVAQHARLIGLKKSAAFYASAMARRTRFVKGQPSWNKGLSYQPGGRCAETQFKPGQKPKTWVPVGTEVVDEEGYLKRKVRDDAPKGMSRQNWVFVHRALWEQHHGPIPRGHAVVFRNGDKSDIRIENLELVTRRALMARNTVHNLPKPIAQLVQLKGAVMRQINRRSRQNGE